MSFKVSFASSPSFQAKFAPPTAEKVQFSEFIEVPVVDYFDGPYEATPSAQAQTIPVIGKTMRTNFTVNPIPNNYGLITWNGATLTVS